MPLGWPWGPGAAVGFRGGGVNAPLGMPPAPHPTAAATGGPRASAPAILSSLTRSCHRRDDSVTERLALVVEQRKALGYVSMLRGKSPWREGC